MKCTIKPISPNEIQESLADIIPPEIVMAVNNLLKKKFRGNSVTIYQKEIEAEVFKINPKMTSEMIYDNHWMDFEPLFVAQGWDIEYDKPGYNESYEAYFIFTRSK